jgi:hypothetical protein
MPFATYRNHGIVFAGGSDFPVTNLSPGKGLWATVAREAPKGTFGANPFGSTESVNVHVALKSFTIWAARQLFIEKEAGTICMAGNLRSSRSIVVLPLRSSICLQMGINTTIPMNRNQMAVLHDALAVAYAKERHRPALNYFQNAARIAVCRLMLA